MSDQTYARTDPFFVSRLAHVVERTGLAMAGAMCGTFVAAYLTRAGIDSIGFIAAMILVGIIGFYLGIDIPGLRACPFVRLGKTPDDRGGTPLNCSAQPERSLPRWPR